MRRTRFDDAHCPIARVTDLFGDWWTPIILRDAMFGIRRFDDFQKSLGVSRAVLSARLTRLVDEGLMDKVEYQQNPVRHEYRLTDKGMAASDVLIAMWRFGEDHLWADGEQPPLELAFRASRERVRAVVVDEATGRRLEPAELRMQRRRG
ncbi:MAG: helix-turn-helix domain-containing protein [Actinomycetota bacterium]